MTGEETASLAEIRKGEFVAITGFLAIFFNERTWAAKPGFIPSGKAKPAVHPLCHMPIFSCGWCTPKGPVYPPIIQSLQ